MKTLCCAFLGHKWSPGTPLHGHDFCRRCKTYDDDAKNVRASALSSAIRRWSPVWVTLRRRDLTLRVSLPWRGTISGQVRLHFGFERVGELPGLGVSLNIWRLHLSAGIGQGWFDEDGDGRSFAFVHATFTTYGLRYIGCWFGHKPREATRMAGYVYCDRCDTELVRPERDEVLAA